MPRWLAHLLIVVGWLLTPVLAWSASYIGLWAGALVATGFNRPVTMLVVAAAVATLCGFTALLDRKSTRLNSSHRCISYAVFCLKKKNHLHHRTSPAHTSDPAR